MRHTDADQQTITHTKTERRTEKDTNVLIIGAVSADRQHARAFAHSPAAGARSLTGSMCHGLVCLLLQYWQLLIGYVYHLQENEAVEEGGREGGKEEKEGTRARSDMHSHAHSNGNTRHIRTLPHTHQHIRGTPFAFQPSALSARIPPCLCCRALPVSLRSQ